MRRVVPRQRRVVLLLLAGLFALTGALAIDDAASSALSRLPTRHTAATTATAPNYGYDPGAHNVRTVHLHAVGSGSQLGGTTEARRQSVAARLVWRVRVAAEDGLSWAEQSGILRAAARGKGNFGVGSATSQEADALGQAWVGDNYTVASDGRTLVSENGLRQYRPPSYKPNLGRYQANFEQRFEGQQTRGWQSNGHLDITNLP